MDPWIIPELIKAGVPPLAIAVIAWLAREVGKLEKRLAAIEEGWHRLDKKAAVVIARLNRIDGDASMPPVDPEGGQRAA